ncbi:MAG: DUF305 domain-containing protein [Chitinophagaceae bacterium]|nr:MAG: DUF305 domain-containing protein [Chitinophagaceae bacterium]
MNKTFILAGLATIALACNNNGGSNDHTNHAAHQDTSSNTKNKNQMNPITETMDKMMHQMHGATPTGNNDIDFAAMMVEHHKGAVEMAEVEVSKGANPELKAFAQQVIDDQDKEIRFMQEFIAKAAKTKSPNAEQFQKALNQSMMAMMNDKPTIYNDIDKDFAAQMVPHHQSAVDMAKAYLEFGQEQSLKTLCENIVRSQTSEIAWLNKWLAKQAS